MGLYFILAVNNTKNSFFIKEECLSTWGVTMACVLMKLKKNNPFYQMYLRYEYVRNKQFTMLLFQEQLNSLVELNNNQDERIAEMELELEKLRHMNCLDEALELQVNCSSVSFAIAFSSDEYYQIVLYIVSIYCILVA